MPIDLGAAVRLRAECRDPGGTLTTAATAALTITLPDGMTASPTVTAPAETGVYVHDYTTSAAGRHSVRWVWTGPAAAYTDTFDVREAEPPLILSLADAKAHLNITSTTHDAELRGWIETTTRCVEYFVGPVARRTVVETHDDLPRGGARAVALYGGGPVIGITEVAAILTGGASYNVDDLNVDEAGIVRRLDGGRLLGPLRFTYIAGRTVITANITSAARVILQHLWRTQHPTGSGRPQLGTDDYAVTEPIAGIGYAIPNRALHLLEADRLPPGVG